ncbi:[protein-PII] uridylyltransferase [Rhodospirillaceae bacterium SYSU D60014]|uniref:[protein-PII] uridylyltransferase n=1 Tax=Virgifigura deserti TaxID=2268457 RepID=UPI000E662CFF
MESIRDQRAIIDRRKLAAALSDIAAVKLDATAERAAVLVALRTVLAAGREEIRRRFDASADGRAVARETCFLVDQLIRTLYDFTAIHVYPVANPSAAEHVAIVAVGGYGRGEMAPHSDVDLLFLLPYKLTPSTEQVVEYILYRLWDLGLKVGHATRSIDDCMRQAKGDMTIRTSLLEARFLAGKPALFQEMRSRFQKEIVTGSGPDFVEAKLAERDERHRRMGDSRYALEPNIKEGKGGLRDLHTLFWIAKYLYRVDDVAVLIDRGVLTRKEVKIFEKAQTFLWTLRCHLHYLTARAEERLTFDVQAEISRRMGYTDHAGTKGVERLMKHYFLIAKSVGNLTRIFCAMLEAEHQRKPLFRLPTLGLLRREIEGFGFDNGRLTVPDAQTFTADPVNLLRLFHVAQRYELDIHPAALRLVTQHLKLVNRQLRADPEANRLFVEMLTSPKGPEATLRRLNEAGIFGRFIPDFGRVVAQMQYDMYHHYTVDEHTIFAIGILHRIEQGVLKDEVPIASHAVHKVLSRRVLYLAVLLHDIAKGRGGDHSELGARVAQKLCPRLGLSDEETETVAWLVRHHLLMSNSAFKRDIDDPKTIADFADQVQSLERLRLLLVLTVADIRAVGPKTWNGWKAALLRELYYRTEEQLSGGLVTEGREARVAAAIAALTAELPDWSDAERAAHIARGYPSYWLSFDATTHARHARQVQAAEAAGEMLSINVQIDLWRAVTEVTVYTPDQPGLFSRLAGAFAISGANIVDARIFTLANGMALDSFWVQDDEGRAFDRLERLTRLKATVARVLAGGPGPMAELERRKPAFPSRLAVFKVAPRVLIDNRASNSHTVIEVNGRDRKGLLHQLTWALTDLNLQISSAKISTYGERAVDVFYVKDLFGLKVENEIKLKAIRARLIEVLEEPAAEASSAAKAAKDTAAAE